VAVIIMILGNKMFASAADIKLIGCDQRI